MVVNCAGLGSRRLAGDLDVRPVRGQVVVVDGHLLDRWWLDSAGPTYVVPRSDTVVVGGTDEHDDWSRTPSPETAAEILRRATGWCPRWPTPGSSPTASACARCARWCARGGGPGGALLRPGRGGRHVSWGCADEVTALVEEMG